MFIDKTEINLHSDVLKTLNKVLKRDVIVVRIRYVKDWSYFDKEGDEDVQIVEPGYLVEYNDENDSKRRRLLFGDSEMFVDGEPPEREYEHHLGKEFLCYELWHEFPVILGELYEPFDEEEDYQPEGKYASSDYIDFEPKFS